MLLHVLMWLCMRTVFASQSEFSTDLESSLQQLLNLFTFYSKGTALSLGVALPNRTISLTSGHRRMYGNNVNDSGLALPSDAFAMGSTTKMYTAAAVLRLVDAGKIGLDDKALPHLDTLWTRLNGTSIVNVLGPQIGNVTVRQLLQMRSGIPDFDNMASRAYQLDHPGEDMGPVKELSFILPGQSFDCEPGTCGEYSSSNYELLGLLLAQQADSQAWDDYMQATGLPGNVLGEMPHTTFARHGSCQKYTEIHGYSAERTSAQGVPLDVYNESCTNGWTCGNLMSNGADAAVFVRALLGPGAHVVKAATQKEMLKTIPLTQGWSVGLQYGLGVMDLSSAIGEQTGSFVGHGGETFGFNALTAYSMQHDFAISAVANTENTFLVNKLMPEVYKRVMNATLPAKVESVIV